MSPKSTTRLSIIVVILQGQDDYLQRCLTALTDQENVRDMEIVVPYDDGPRNISQLPAQFPEVQFVHVPGHHTYAELRAVGVRHSSGDVVALTEDHCIPEPDWGAQILAEHANLYAAVGGAVNKKAPDTALNWSLYLADYVRYMNPVADGPSHELTDCNVSYKRTALDKIAAVWQQEFHEPEVHGALQAKGETLWLSSRVVVQQQREINLAKAIRDRYTFGRLFGSGRVKAASLSQRLIYAAVAVFLPVLLVGRVAGHVFRKGRCRGAFFNALPFVILVNTVWAWGECMGYLTGRAEASLTPGQRAGSVA